MGLKKLQWAKMGFNLSKLAKLVEMSQIGPTVGVIRNETLVFVNFSAQDASILKISVPIIKRRS